MDDIDFDEIDKAVNEVMDDRQKAKVTRVKATESSSTTTKPAPKLQQTIKHRPPVQPLPKPVAQPISPIKTTVRQVSANPVPKPPKTQQFNDIKATNATIQPETAEAIRKRRQASRRQRVQAVASQTANKPLVSDFNHHSPRVTRMVARPSTKAEVPARVATTQPKVTRLVVSPAVPTISQQSAKFSVPPRKLVTPEGAVETKTIDGEYSSQTLTTPVSDKTTVKYHTSNLSYVERVELDDRLIEADRQMLSGVHNLDDKDEVISLKPRVAKQPQPVKKPEPAPFAPIKPAPTKPTSPIKKSETDEAELKTSPFVEEVKVEKRPLGEPAKLTNAQLPQENFVPALAEKPNTKPVPLYSADSSIDDEEAPARATSVGRLLLWLIVVVALGVTLGVVAFAFDLF